MRLRIRSRSGVETITVEADTTIAQLYHRLSASSISHGFPPRPLPPSTPTDTKISSILRDGDVIIVTPGPPPASNASAAPAANATAAAPKPTAPTKHSKPNTDRSPPASTLVPTTTRPTSTVPVSPPLPSSIQSEVIDIPASSSRASVPIASPPANSSAPAASASDSLASHGNVELREVPDDNSCLFRCVGAVSGLGRSESALLRKVICDAVLARQHEFSAAILEKEPMDYAAWIQSDHAWGGPIELMIFADHFEIQIAAFDLITMRLDTYGHQYQTVVYLMYNGIHYNYCALSISGIDQDITQFPANDTLVLEKVRYIAQMLHDSKQYTNTNTFTLRCLQCGALLYGAEHANRHAAETGHTQFEEVKG